MQHVITKESYTYHCSDHYCPGHQGWKLICKCGWTYNLGEFDHRYPEQLARREHEQFAYQEALAQIANLPISFD